MGTSVPTGAAKRARWAAAAGTWALRIALVAGSLTAFRAAGRPYREALAEGRREFRELESLASPRAMAAYGLVIAGAFLFTLACRLPIRGGVSWPPLVLGLVPLLLASHLLLFGWFQEALADALWAQPFYFWNEEQTRWVMLALIGVALGTAIRGRADRPASEPGSSD